MRLPKNGVAFDVALADQGDGAATRASALPVLGGGVDGAA
jgi:hypothetical protein